MSPGPVLRRIGTVRTPYARREDAPLQPVFDPETEGILEVDPEYADALDGLGEFSHIWLLTWLGPPDDAAPLPELRQVPLLLRETPRELGIFATRGPRRPNPIALSLVKLLSIDGCTLRFAGTDLLDGTVLLDVKPFVAMFDLPIDEIRNGWFDERLHDFDPRQGARP